VETDAFERSLRAFARRAPFQPFVVELVSGTRVEVDHPEALVFRGGAAVYISAAGIPTLFDHQSVSRLSSAGGPTVTATGGGG
jgi:hypothetical protein